jgi:monoamine oxidase
MALQVPCGRPWAAALASEWDAMTLQEWLKKTARSPHAIALFNSAARVIFGADAGELSFLHVLHYVHQSGGLMNLIEAEGGNQQWRVTGGTQQLSEWLARDLDLVLESPVHAIEQDERGVLVHSAKGSWTAARVVVAMPPHLMHRIDCRPPLPTLRSQLHQRSAMGATIKCFALYDRAFWRERGLSGESVTTSGPVSMSMDNFNSAGQPGLVVFLTGAPARGWSERAETTRRALVLGALGQYFGEEASHPTCYHEMDWSTERFSGGAPVSNLSPGTWTTFGPALYAPVGRIHWAGTETARESTGFMEGALESGQRVAAEILEALS